MREVDNAVDNIKNNLFGRSGFGNVWDDIDDEIREEITQMMKDNILKVLDTITKQMADSQKKSPKSKVQEPK